ncbi:MAG: Homogentisate phytyltransferase [Chroococcopsis gigantea SAG 12.99]|jgi:homogentisate phytyltransferase/homogentisate geranylgeranyltransferase|nr:homogentisate phytyltransferase [Chlorogloea purpurea SAG 13.99]MDV2999670.1 Homogentisate phytyltransferase [Chroococcopsis gigantea SAG 12.99]
MTQLASHNSLSSLRSLWKFSRPHTIIGTSLSVFALYAIAWSNNNTINPWFLLGAWIACLCGNVYIVGLNQLEDIQIDKINKPSLPLASGEFSVSTGKIIVGIAGILGILIAALCGTWLLLTVGVSLSIGTAYSLPPIRLKRFPLAAAMCIFTVRGVIVNLGLFLYFNDGKIIPSVWLLTLFVLVFTVSIAIFKDVPDLEGDKQYQISTFTLILGKNKVFNFTLIIISLCYLGMIVAGFLKISGIDSKILILGHLGLLGLLWSRSRGVNLEEKPEISAFYQFIWKLFFFEYLLFPLACIF